jgi:hypothetical protein
MPIALEHINFIVRRSTIEEKYPGGWDQCLIDHASSLGTRVWYDEHLFRDGAMNPIDMESLVNAWRAIGFQAILINSEKKWLDCCVIDESLETLTLSCDWIKIDLAGAFAYLKDQDPSEIMGRYAF